MKSYIENAENRAWETVTFVYIDALHILILNLIYLITHFHRWLQQSRLNIHLLGN